MSEPNIQGFSAAERAAILAARDRAANGTPTLVRHAFLSAQLSVGPISLRPVTLSDWIALEELDHSAIVGGTFSPLDEAHLIFILAHEPLTIRTALAKGRQIFSQLANNFLSQRLQLVEALSVTACRQLRLATSTVINKNRSGNDPFQHLPEKTSGCGWALTVADVLAHEYGWSHVTIWDEVPLADIFAYYTAIKARCDEKPTGISYAEQDMIAAHRGATETDDAR